MVEAGNIEEPGAVDLIDPSEPFEVDDQLAHLSKHWPYGLDDAYDVFFGDPVFFEDLSDGPADWLMVGEVPGGAVLVVPLAPSRSGDFTKMRPVTVFEASHELVDRYVQLRGG